MRKCSLLCARDLFIVFSCTQLFLNTTPAWPIFDFFYHIINTTGVYIVFRMNYGLVVLLQSVSVIARQWKGDYEGEVVTDVLKEACKGIRMNGNVACMTVVASNLLHLLMFCYCGKDKKLSKRFSPIVML